MHDALQGGAHLGLELAVFGMALLEQALGDREPRLMAGQRDTELGALQFEIGAQAQITAEHAAADRRDHDDRLHEMAEVDVGGEMRVQHAVGHGHGRVPKLQFTIRR